MKTKLRAIVSRLDFASSAIRDADGVIRSNYYVDNNHTPIADKTKKLGEDVNLTANKISGEVIPAIEVAVKNKRSEIARLEEEKRRQEEENRRREEVNKRGR